MAKKVAQVDIKLTGLNTISQLEQELADINKQLKDIDINSAEFDTLSQKAATATQKLETINTQLKGVSAQEKTDAIKKLGEGLVGAFQVGAGASLLFGEKTSEELNKVIAKVAGVYSAVDGLDKISKAFSSENISRLKALGNQFKIVGNGAKIMGVTMKTALISSGIGILVVALGTVAANWDKITAAIKRNKAEKARENEAKQLETEIKAQEDMLKLLEEEAAAEKKINDIAGESEKNAQVDIDLTKEKIALIEKENELLVNQQVALQERFNEENKIYENTKKLRAAYEAQGINFDEFLKAAKDRKENAEAELELNKKNIVVNQTNIKLLEEEQRLLQNDKNSKPYKDGIKLAESTIDLYKRQNELSEASGLQAQKIYERNKKSVDLEKSILSLKSATGKITSEEYNKELAALEHQDKLLDITNKRRREALELQIKTTGAAIQYETDLENVKIEYENINDLLTENDILLNKSNRIIESNSDSYNNLVKEYERFLEIQSDGYNFDKKREKINDIILSQYNDWETALGGATEFLESEYDISKEIIVGISEGLKLDEAKLKVAADRISIERNLTDAVNRQLETQKKILLENEVILESDNNRLIALNKIEKARLDAIGNDILAKKTQFEATDNLELRAKLIQEINGLLNDGNQIQNNIKSNESSITENKRKQAELFQDRISIDQTITDNATQLKQTEIEITGELVKQSRVSEELNDWAEKYREEIQATLDVMNAGFEFAGALLERQVAKSQKDIDNSQKRVKKLQKEQDEFDKRNEKSTKRLIDLQDKLKDADGERYDELLDMIAKEQSANQEAAVNNEEAIKEETNLQLKAQYDIDMANYRGAVLDKTQAAINSAIFTLLAVVKALPNVFLSTAVGIAGGLATAAIIAKPLPPKPSEPEYLEEGGLLQGRSHKEGGIPVEAEGGEFIINKRSTSKYLPLLEAINESGRRKFADGGVVVPTVTAPNNSDLIDYARLAGEIAKLNIMVSVVDINKGMNRVKVVQNSASL